jgi:hypothetical protein
MYSMTANRSYALVYSGPYEIESTVPQGYSATFRNIKWTYDNQYQTSSSCSPDCECVDAAIGKQINTTSKLNGELYD